MIYSTLLAALVAVVPFKDAAKIRSWDAWGDNGKTPTKTAFKERRCVTRENLLKMDPGLEDDGWLETRPARDIRASNWSVGCETLDRDYADWDQYKGLLADLGAKRARFFSGWAKTEQEKGRYDFAWLDRQIRECAAMGVKPWVCISYGNPVWGSDFRLGMRVKQVTGDRAAFDAWLRYTRTLVARYRDVVDEWEIWNEPFHQAKDYAEMVYETAKAIREVQPSAKCIVTAISWAAEPEKNDYVAVLEKLKRENALGLVNAWIYHPYVANPDTSYETRALPLRRLVKGYSPDYDIIQGEVGCPGQLEYAHAMNSFEWTEYSQAKWDLRRAIGDAVRGIPSNLFTFIDLQYTFMLQSFGLVRSNTLKQPVYRRPSYFAMQNVYSYFDENVHPIGIEKRTVNGKELSVARFELQSSPVWVVWFSGERPGDGLAYERADLSFLGKCGPLPRWVDLMTGRICRLEDLKSVPVWDSPVMIVRSRLLPRRTVWAEMKPAEIVDALYCPHERRPIMMDVSKEPWTGMATADFLPCFDRYGQFKWREWPGKTHSDEELKAVTAEEEADLAAHPGPDGRDRFGGWAAGPRLEATGRFRTEKRDGRWWLVDPDGNLFWSWGAVRVTPSSALTPLNGNPRSSLVGGPYPDRDCLFEGLPRKGEPLAAFYDTYDSLLLPFFLKRGETRRYDFSAANLWRKYGEDWFARFSDSCHRRLRSWGCNTIANSSDLRICLQDRTPYAERVECLSRPIAGSWGHWFKFRDPFDDSFKAGCKAELEKHGREAHDPWCIGFFIDNEIQWGARHEDLARWTLWSPDDQPAKVEFVRRLRAKGIDPKTDAVPEAELKAFTAAIVEEYFKRTREAVKEFDPGLLYLGCRFAGSARPWVIGACAKYADVISYNIYRDQIGDWRLPQGLDAPVLVGEFHFGAHDRGLFNSGLVNKGSQEGRAAALKAYVESALGNPQIVGVHWHQFSDQATSGRFDGECMQVGWTDVCDRPYKETVDALRSIDIYATRGTADESRAKPVLVPMPREVTWREGTCPASAPVAERRDASVPKEGYRLTVAADGITVVSSDAAGAFYARQTLRQLAEVDGARTNYPCCAIVDAPAFPWRGVLIDEGRHFQGKEMVKRMLDLMAYHKLNVLHWHLTEDQGWRLDVPGMPELAQYGSVRAESPCHGASLKRLGRFRYASEAMDGTRYGPFFYTRADLDEVVAYACARHVTVVPEIELPGHSKGALAAFPALACFPENINPRLADSDWGITTDVLCVGNDETLRFLEKVLDYVCEVFPSEVIHIGGDECPTVAWEKCPKCQARMKAEGLSRPGELQNWITRKVADYLAKKGRRIMGWDEILNGDVPKSAIGQSWRTQNGNGAGNELVKGADGVARGHDMVMSPHTECYYSYDAGLKEDPFTRTGARLTLERAYAFDPLTGVADAHRVHVLGSEACVWGEYVWNLYDYDWRMWPRGCAMAEILWTYPESRDFAAFRRRIAAHRRRLIADFHVNCQPLE